MVSFEGQPYRRGSIDGQGTVDGLGDLRLGFFSGLVTARVRLSVGLLAGVPTGDAKPSASSSTDFDAQQIARALPTGDGENDVELRLSLGHGFGRFRRWPLQHYLASNAGVWLRSEGFSHAVVYKVELGTKLPWRVVDRLWFAGVLGGVESFATTDELRRNTTPNATGLGNGVSYTYAGGKLFARLWGGLGVGVQVDAPLRGRLVPVALNLKVGVSWER